jgi:hypothetical protein
MRPTEPPPSVLLPSRSNKMKPISKLGSAFTGLYFVAVLSIFAFADWLGVLFLAALPWALLFHPFSFRGWPDSILVLLYILLFVLNLFLCYLVGFLAENLLLRPRNTRTREKRRLKLLKALKLTCILYVGSYAVFSLTGYYHETEDLHGRKFAVWHPRFCRTETTWRNLPSTNITWAGGLYLPLLLVDNKFIHPTRLTFSVKGDGFRVAYISENGKRIIEQ